MIDKTKTRTGCQAIRSQYDVAKILGISRAAVYQGEKRALKKMARHPLLRRLWEESKGGGAPMSYLADAQKYMRRGVKIGLKPILREEEMAAGQDRAQLKEDFMVYLGGEVARKILDDHKDDENFQAVMGPIIGQVFREALDEVWP